MLKRLYRNLFLLFFIIMSSIIICILFITFHFQKKQLLDFNQSVYHANLNSLNDRFTSSKLISNTLLAREEAANHSLIHIELNGMPAMFQGSCYTGTARSRLIEQVFFLTSSRLSPPESWDTSLSAGPVFRLEDSLGHSCYGSVQYWNDAGELKTLLYVQGFPQEKESIRRLALLFILIALLSLVLLYICSHFLVSIAIKPVAENNQRQTEFIAAASHELRSPLTVILNHTLAIRSVTAQAESFILPVERECRRMARLIDDMLILASSDAGTWDIKGEEIETDTFIIGIYEKYGPICEKRRHPLRIQLSENSLPSFTGDRERLEQVFAALLDNALSYTPEGTPIDLAADIKGHTLILQVADHGPGISAEDKKRIFNRFYRTDHSRNQKSHYGLGLSIAKELVELHNGQLCLKDTPGGGACFVITFPCKRCTPSMPSCHQ